MKCPNCGQEMIEDKEFCPNCGKQLKEEKGMSKKSILLIFVALFLLGIGICVGIMFVGTDKELDPYLNNNTEIVMDNYYGNYYIKDVIVNTNTPESIVENKDNLLNWNVEVNSLIIKFPLAGMNWTVIDNPVYVEENSDDFIGLFDDDTLDILVNSASTSNPLDIDEKIYVIVYDSNFYLYYDNALFELESETENYKDNINFYNLSFPDLVYSTEINDEISSFKNWMIERIETNETYSYIYEVEHENFVEEDFNSIIITYNIGLIEASYQTFYETIVYDDDYNIYNLGEYLGTISKTISDIDTAYKAAADLYFIEEGVPFGEYVELTEDTNYYINNEKLFLPVSLEEMSFGQMFIEVNLD